MGKLEKLPNGRYRITGGFSTANEADMEMLRGIVRESSSLFRESVESKKR